MLIVMHPENLGAVHATLAKLGGVMIGPETAAIPGVGLVQVMVREDAPLTRDGKPAVAVAESLSRATPYTREEVARMFRRGNLI